MVRGAVSKIARDSPASRWFVVTAAVFGVAAFAYQAIWSEEELYPAFLKAAGASALVMVLLGLGQRQWEGDRLQGGTLPGGGGAQFEPREAAQETRAAVEKLNERVSTHAEQLIDLQRQLDKRVTDLENAVFKDTSAHGPRGMAEE